MEDLSPRAVRSSRRSQSRSPRPEPGSATRFELHAQANLSPKAARSRPCSPTKSSLIDPGSSTRSEYDAQRGFEFKDCFTRLVVKRILSVVTIIAMVALAIFYGQSDGPKLAKRNAALAPGDRLKGGEYISFCTSIIATECKPKYLLLSRDGSLGMYEGSRPHARTTKLWSASVNFKGNAQSVYELAYTGDNIILHEDGKAYASLSSWSISSGITAGDSGGSRGSSGLGWYQRYKRLGPDAFRKARAPNPFDWETSSGENSGGKGPALDKRRRRRAFFDMAVDGVAAGRVEFELAADILPVTCENFLRLCKGVDVAPPVKRAVRVSITGEVLEQDEAEEEQDAARDPKMTLGYEGTLIHQVATGTGIMGGDVEGTGGSRSHSGFGTRFFPDEAFLIPHTAPGLLTTANPGVHRNGSQFYITTEPAGHLDGRSVAFGRVTSGMEVVRALYGMYSIRGKPVSEITVAKCGEIAANPTP